MAFLVSFRRINVGSRFQAEIPPVRDTLYMLYEEHPAQLVWTPWKDLSTNTETQQRGKHTNTHSLLSQYHLPGIKKLQFITN